jgi:hypothetical protein
MCDELVGSIAIAFTKRFGRPVVALLRSSWCHVPPAFVTMPRWKPVPSVDVSLGLQAPHQPA